MPFSEHDLYLEDVETGVSWESGSRILTEEDIILFANLSGDDNPIHLDHEFAKTTTFRRVVGHGLLILSFVGGLTRQAPPLRTLAFLGMKDWQFKHPVFIGDTVRVRSTATDKVVRGRGNLGTITWLRQVFNQDNKIVQEGITVTLVEGRKNVRPVEKATIFDQGTANPPASSRKTA